MSLAMVLLPMLFVYILVVIWLLIRFRSKIFPVISETMPATDKRLTKLVYRCLGLFAGFILCILLLLLPLLVVMSISQYDNPDWGIDIGVFSYLSINLNEIVGLVVEPSGIRNPEFSTSAVINIDTYSIFAYYLFAITSGVGGIVVLYIVLQLRTLFASLLNGLTLTPENSSRIRKIGYAIFTWSLATPFIQYFGGRAVLNDIAFNAPGFQLSPAFEIPVIGIFTGLIIIILSGVLNEAAKIQEDQELTI